MRMSDNDLCSSCESEGESIKHLLEECPGTKSFRERVHHWVEEKMVEKIQPDNSHRRLYRILKVVYGVIIINNKLLYLLKEYS